MQDGPDVSGDDLVPIAIGVLAVGEVEVGVTSDVLQEKRDERGVICRGQFREYRSETIAVIGAHIGRHLHPGNGDNRGGILVADAVDDSLEIRPRMVWINPAKAIVGAQCKDEDVDGSAKKPRDPTYAAGRRVSAESCVHDPERPSKRVDSSLYESGVGPVFTDTTIPGCQAVTQNEDASGRRGVGSRFGATGGQEGRRQQQGVCKSDSCDVDSLVRMVGGVWENVLRSTSTVNFGWRSDVGIEQVDDIG